ncbi:MAG: hypothetical protein QOF54_468 [Solirubrobacteraceae bacterium]|jgi:uncharacterized protein YbjQ (UPF0145 family)|nr:hypothetical protein [Solirubrobacteraceae bacterium]
MIVTTMNDLPGYTIDEVLGEVFGLTVRARNIGSQFGATLKSLVGGELKGMTKMLAEGRVHAQERLEEEAAAKGADAIIAFRFDTSELGQTWTEICAYGTAVRTTKL